MVKEARPKGRPARFRGEGSTPDTRMDKSLRVLEALKDHAESGDGTCLDRARLSDAAGVTLRNLDAILKSLRNGGYDILWEDTRGYRLAAAAGPGFCIRSPGGFRALGSLRSFVDDHAELVERDHWLALLDDIIADSERTRKKRMGRDFEEALVDGEGRMYRVAEPEILYLNVHRSRPESLTRSHVERLREAIRAFHPVRMRYVDRNGDKDTIRVQPYFLFHREGTFYLGGVQTHSGDRPMKIPRFKPFTITSMRCLGFDVLVDETFVPLPRYSAAKRLTRTGIRNLDGEMPVEAEFEVFGRFAYNACETDHGEQSEHEWVRSGPRAQHLRMKATFGSLYDLVRYILSFGRYAVLDKPESVRAILIDNIKGMAERYGLSVVETDKGKIPSI